MILKFKDERGFQITADISKVAWKNLNHRAKLLGISIEELASNLSAQGTLQKYLEMRN